MRLSKQFSISVPSCSIHKQSFDVDTVLRGRVIVTVIKDIKVKAKKINGDAILASKVLLRT